MTLQQVIQESKQNSGGWKLVSFSPIHLRLMTPDSFQKQQLINYPGHTEILEHQAKLGPSGTLLHQGAVIASFGFVEIHTGVFEAWLWRDRSRSSRRVVASLRLSREIFDQLGRILPLHRAQFYVQRQNSPAVRYAKWLDFHCEGVLKRYGPDQTDYEIYARLYG